ncbi:MAG: T9SS type A sorting domain-containing protein [Saprospiraceae bacterium]|nr:T9SS type A sorting domain-containing protein [Saprospiraceae bacterium]
MLETEGYFDSFLITDNSIILLNNYYDWENMANHRYVLQRFDRDGNPLNERQLNTRRMATTTLLPFGENSILLAGSVILSDSQSYSIVWKLDIGVSTTTEGLEQASPAAATEVAASSSPIADMTVEALSQEAMSVAVFPNPASIYINFELKNREDTKPNFLLKVADMNGKQMHQASFQSVYYELDIAQFPPGTYAYQIINQKDKKDFLTGKFVKIR